jgi:hypothetical protein
MKRGDDKKSRKARRRLRPPYGNRANLIDCRIPCAIARRESAAGRRHEKMGEDGKALNCALVFYGDSLKLVMCKLAEISMAKDFTDAQ